MRNNTGHVCLPFHRANFLSHLSGVLFFSFVVSNEVLPMATKKTKKNWGSARRAGHCNCPKLTL